MPEGAQVPEAHVPDGAKGASAEGRGDITSKENDCGGVGMMTLESDRSSNLALWHTAI